VRAEGCVSQYFTPGRSRPCEDAWLGSNDAGGACIARIEGATPPAACVGARSLTDELEAFVHGARTRGVVGAERLRPAFEPDDRRAAERWPNEGRRDRITSPLRGSPRTDTS
jgi:hypothetical protein